MTSRNQTNVCAILRQHGGALQKVAPGVWTWAGQQSPTRNSSARCKGSAWPWHTTDRTVRAMHSNGLLFDPTKSNLFQTGLGQAQFLKLTSKGWRTYHARKSKTESTRPNPVSLVSEAHTTQRSLDIRRSGKSNSTLTDTEGDPK